MSGGFNTNMTENIHDFCGEMKDSPLNGITGVCKIEKVENDHMGGIDWEGKAREESGEPRSEWGKKDGGKKDGGKKEGGKKDGDKKDGGKKDEKRDGKKEGKKDGKNESKKDGKKDKK